MSGDSNKKRKCGSVNTATPCYYSEEELRKVVGYVAEEGVRRHGEIMKLLHDALGRGGNEKSMLERTSDEMAQSAITKIFGFKADARSTKQQLKGLRKKLEESDEKIRDLWEMNGASRELDLSSAQVNSSQLQNLSAAEEKLEKCVKEVGSLRQELQSTQEALKVSRAETESAQEALKASEKKSGPIQEELESTQKELKSAQGELKASRAETESAQEALKAAEKKAGSMQQELESAQEALKVSRTETESAQEALKVARTETESAQEALKDAEKKSGSVQQELESAREALKDAEKKSGSMQQELESAHQAALNVAAGMRTELHEERQKLEVQIQAARDKEEQLRSLQSSVGESDAQHARELATTVRKYENANSLLEMEKERREFISKRAHDEGATLLNQIQVLERDQRKLQEDLKKKERQICDAAF